MFEGFVSAALVDMFGKCRCLEMAMEVFEQIPMKTLVSWNPIIARCNLICDNSPRIELLKIMKDMS